MLREGGRRSRRRGTEASGTVREGGSRRRGTGREGGSTHGRRERQFEGGWD